MTLHTGRVYRQGSVSICPPDPVEISNTPKSADVAGQVEHWLASALEREDVFYFSVRREDQLVGEIFLHDINWQSGEALVGYHLFGPRYRGLGTGAQALDLVKTFVVENIRLDRLVIITSANNMASQRVAQKCDFIYVGVPREDPDGLVFQWDIPSRMEHD